MTVAVQRVTITVPVDDQGKVEESKPRDATEQDEEVEQSTPRDATEQHEEVEEPTSRDAIKQVKEMDESTLRDATEQDEEVKESPSPATGPSAAAQDLLPVLADVRWQGGNRLRQ